MLLPISSTALWYILFGVTIFQTSFCLGCNTLDCCNGVKGLCRVPVNEVLFGQVHNAMSSPSHGFLFLANHLNDPIIESLDVGFRSLSLDLCNCDGDMEFCHGGDEVGCGVGRRQPQETYTEIEKWLNNNPRNVLQIHLEVNEDAGGPISLTDVYNTLPESLKKRLFIHNAGEEWPTLGEMIDSGKNVLFFYSRGPHGEGYHPLGIHYFFDYAQRTHWQWSSPEAIKQNALDNSCQIRGNGGKDFFLFNAFVLEPFWNVEYAKPDRDSAKVVNTVEFLTPLLKACEEAHGKSVNMVTVDFWKVGNVNELVRVHNTELAANYPSLSPTKRPTTPMPTRRPTTRLPTSSPSRRPTPSPTRSPTKVPTSHPTDSPNVLPTPSPTTRSSTVQPTGQPSLRPDNNNVSKSEEGLASSSAFGIFSVPQMLATAIAFLSFAWATL